jgi:16S rRNA C1402 N4-methylase RsmH
MRLPSQVWLCLRCRAKVRLLRRGAVKADAAELERNPRSESVRIRAVESVRFLPRAELAEVKVDAS